MKEFSDIILIIPNCIKITATLFESYEFKLDNIKFEFLTELMIVLC